MKRQDETPVIPEIEDATVPDVEHDEDQYIVYRIPRMEGNVQMYDEHRINIKDREAFETEHGL